MVRRNGKKKKNETKQGQVAHRLEATGENPAVDSAKEMEITLIFQRLPAHSVPMKRTPLLDADHPKTMPRGWRWARS